MVQVAITTHDKAYREIVHFVRQANKAQQSFKFRRIFLRKEYRSEFDGDEFYAPTLLQAAFHLKRKYGLQPDDPLVVVVDGDLQDDEDNEHFVITSDEYPGLAGTCPRTAALSLFYKRPDSTFSRQKEWINMPKSERDVALSNSVHVLLLGAVAAIMTDAKFHYETEECIMDECQIPSDLLFAATTSFRFCEKFCSPILQACDEGRVILEVARQLIENPYVPLRGRGRAIAVDSYARLWSNDPEAHGRNVGRKKFKDFLAQKERYAIFIVDRGEYRMNLVGETYFYGQQVYRRQTRRAGNDARKTKHGKDHLTRLEYRILSYLLKNRQEDGCRSIIDLIRQCWRDTSNAEDLRTVSNPDDFQDLTSKYRKKVSSD